MKIFPAVFLTIAFLVGCAARVNHPGTVNSFDSSAYDVLLVTDNVIQTTKADLAANKFPAAISGNVKTALNGLITAYDALDIAYCGMPVTAGGALQCAPGSYHAAAAAGTATAAQQQAITSDVSQVQNANAALTAAKGST